MTRAALVFSGGLGLGSYQAGSYEALLRHGQFNLGRIAGSSVGAVNAALVAGSKAKDAIRTLRAFWSAGDLWFVPLSGGGTIGHAQNWLSVLHTRFFGASGHFRPRLPNPLGPFKSFYDLTPMKERVCALIDFGRLNGGDIEIAVAATDIETGELVIFDTAGGEKITIDHLLASCGFLPEFAPVEIGGRLLGDGGLSANAPIEAVAKHGASADAVFVIDLFARDGTRPDSLEDALARKNDLLFGNQTLQRLEAWIGSGKLGRVAYLSYRPAPDEAGSEKLFDLSRSSIERRWKAGFDDMVHGLQLFGAQAAPGLTVVRRAA